MHWVLVILVPATALSIWDFLQEKHALRRNYPLIARIRWLFEDLRPFLRAYIVESDREGRPFTIDERSLVYARAKGQLDTHPMALSLMSIQRNMNGSDIPLRQMTLLLLSGKRGLGDPIAIDPTLPRCSISPQ